MLSKNFFRTLPKADRSYARDGAAFMGLLAGSFGYIHYRKFLSKELMISEGHYRFQDLITNITPFCQTYYHWWRMPDEEFNAYYRFRPYYVTGQLDTSKEILIPRVKDGADGFDVLSPLYCYEGGTFSIKNKLQGEDPVVLGKSAIVINRGWIHHSQRDKTSRPRDFHSQKLVKVAGCWRKGKNLHDYKYPNNPNNNEWHNIQLEDIGLYWDLPNFDEQKHYYFQATEVGGYNHGTSGEDSYTDKPEAYSIDETIYDHYGWWTKKSFN
jgi:hypothetical protein